MSQREAYVAAGGKAKTDNSKDNAASVMLSNPKVRAFYNSLIDSTTIGAVLSRTEALEILSTNARDSEEKRDQHTAIKQLSEMEGWNAPKKSELTGKNGAPLAVDSKVSAPEVAQALSNLLEKL